MFSSSPKLKKTHSLPDSIRRSPTLSASSVSLSSRLQSNFPPNSQTHTLTHTHIYNSQFTVQSPQQPAMASRFQAIPLVASPSYPNAVAWSDENLIAVASGHLVTILVPLFLTTLLFFSFLFCSCWKKLDALAMKHSKNHN